MHARGPQPNHPPPPAPPSLPACVRTQVMYQRHATVRHVILLQPDPADVADRADAAAAAATLRSCRRQRTVLGATPGALLQLLKLLSQPGGGGAGE